MMTSGPYAEFFEPLVGTPEAMEVFRASLTACVRNDVKDGPVLPSDPYDRLIVRLENNVDAFATAQMGLVLFRPDLVEKIAKNIKIGGVSLVVNMLRSAGSLYETHVSVPQAAARVRRTVHRVLGHVASLAGSDSGASTRTTLANHWGIAHDDPRYELLAELAAPANLEDLVDFTNAFEVTTDDNGQIDLAFRYRNMKPVSDRVCPVTQTYTQVEKGRNEKTLWLYLNVIGDVVRREIYPTQFAIEQPIH